VPPEQQVSTQVFPAGQSAVVVHTGKFAVSLHEKAPSPQKPPPPGSWKHVTTPAPQVPVVHVEPDSHPVHAPVNEQVPGSKGLVQLPGGGAGVQVPLSQVDPASQHVVLEYDGPRCPGFVHNVPPPLPFGPHDE
jgi:hypothetical protein